MIKARLVTLTVILTLAASAQHRQHGGGGGGRYAPPPPMRPVVSGPIGPVGFGFGNVVFPGTGIPQATGHAASLGATVRGVYPPGYGAVGGAGYGYSGGGRGGRVAAPVVVPVPVYVGGGGGYGFGYGYDYAPPQMQQPPNVTVVNTPPEQPAVIINQNYAPERPQPVMRDYSREALPEPSAAGGGLSSYQAPVPSNPDPQPQPSRKPVVANDDNPTVYLIALRDGTVYSAYAYWLEGDTLHYITTRHSHNRASLSLVDEALSAQLNTERSVDWKLKNNRGAGPSAP